MEYLGRDGAPFSEELWDEIDEKVISVAKKVLTARRFLPFKGPVGAGVQFVKVNHKSRTEEFEDGFVKSTGRNIVEIPQLYSDFWLYWRDLEETPLNGVSTDLSAVSYAAQKIAQTEDKMVFYGIPDLGIDGLLTVKGSQALKRSDWTKGEGSFTDIAKAVSMLEQKDYMTSHTLVLSPDLYIQLQRIQQGTGVLEIDRIKNLVDKVIKSTALKNNTALLVSAESYCMDLLVGQDMNTAYLEAVDMNHHLRIMETALLRIKDPAAIVVMK